VIRGATVFGDHRVKLPANQAANQGLIPRIARTVLVPAMRRYRLEGGQERVHVHVGQFLGMVWTSKLAVR